MARQAMEEDMMIKHFNVSEKGHGSYWLLGILRWVMVLIFVSFGIQKFTPQSADGIALYISNSPFVSWLSIFGIRGEAYLLGIIELTTAAVLAAGAFIPILTRLIDGNWYVCDYVVLFLLDARCRQMERIHRPNSMEPHRGILVQRCRPSMCLYRAVFGITAKESRPASVELMSQCVMSWAFLPAINALAQEFSLAIDAQHGSTPSRADPRKGTAITAIFQERTLRGPLSCRSSAHRKMSDRQTATRLCAAIDPARPRADS
jgi:hypothetical protein